MRRRDFISLLGGAAIAWPLVAAAQQSANSKRLAIFSPSEPSADLHEHSESKKYRAFFAELRRLGWIEGHNLKVESYGREQNASGPEALATEIVRSNPDVIHVVWSWRSHLQKANIAYPAKQTIGRRSRASPATVQMGSWSSIRPRPIKRAF